MHLNYNYRNIHRHTTHHWCTNRRAYADLVKRLQVAEAEADCQRHTFNAYCKHSHSESHMHTHSHEHRRAYADLVKRLQVAEVEAERQRRERWENALGSWRSLRSLHAMDLFNERIRCVCLCVCVFAFVYLQHAT